MSIVSTCGAPSPSLSSLPPWSKRNDSNRTNRKHVREVPLRLLRDRSSVEAPVVEQPVVARQGIDFRIASQREELYSALNLVYEAYVYSGLIETNHFELRVTPYHALPTTEVLVAERGSNVVCTMSLIRDGALGLPMENIYAAEIQRRRRQGKHLAEVSCLADDRESCDHSFSVVSRLMALTTQCAKCRDVDELVIAVHPRHAGFYERFLAFEPIGDVKAYGAVLDNPAVALAMDLNRLRLEHPQAHKRLCGRAFPAETVRYRPISAALQAELRFLASQTYNVDPSHEAVKLLASA